MLRPGPLLGGKSYLRSFSEPKFSFFVDVASFRSLRSQQGHSSTHLLSALVAISLPPYLDPGEFPSYSVSHGMYFLAAISPCQDVPTVVGRSAVHSVRKNLSTGQNVRLELLQNSNNFFTLLDQSTGIFCVRTQATGIAKEWGGVGREPDPSNLRMCHCPPSRPLQA